MAYWERRRREEAEAIDQKQKMKEQIKQLLKELAKLRDQENKLLDELWAIAQTQA